MIIGGVEMPTTWWTAERLAEFWDYVKWFMIYNMPIFMICAAVLIAGMVLELAVTPALEARAAVKQDGRRSRDDDDDDD